MPPKRSKANPTPPSRRSPRKKVSNVPQTTRVKGADSQKDQKPDNRSPVPSSEAEIIETCETSNSDAGAELIDIGGVNEGEVDELDNSEGGEIEETEEIDELDELESSILFGRSNPRASAQQSEGSGESILVHSLSIGDQQSADCSP